MPNYIFTLQQRLAGNLYENRYYINGTDEADGIAKAQAIISGQAQIQTKDVEYVGALLTLVEGGHATTPLVPNVTNGNNVEGSLVTLPGAVFLEFVFFPVGVKGKISHRIRGCASNSVTELSVFNIDSSGVGDDDGDAVTPAFTTTYSDYATAVAVNTTDPNGNELSYGTRVSVGFKRAGRSL